MILVIVILGLFFQIYKLQEDVSLLKQIVFLQKGNAVDNHRRIAQKYREISSSVFSIRCQNSAKKPMKWTGTAFKVSADVAVTARHLVDKEFMVDSKEKNVLPISCDLFSEGVLVGNYTSDINPRKDINKLDMSIIKVKFNPEGLRIKPMKINTSHKAFEGEPLLLISHPETFLDDYIISFGYVINQNANKILHADRKSAWENAVLTDMVAAPGASGSPLLTLDQEVIGVHVGGNDKHKLRTNYQILFDTNFYLSLQMFKLQHLEIKEQTPKK